MEVSGRSLSPEVDKGNLHRKEGRQKKKDHQVVSPFGLSDGITIDGGHSNIFNYLK